jgi:hypothetical protein
MTIRRLAVPAPERVEPDSGGRPAAIAELAVEAIGEEWLVEDRWWTDKPIRRRYFEAILTDGRCAVVFCDLVTGRWFSQRG